ncbi:MAG: hypothetical protein N2559_02110 [Anaerolineae bacterium]|nr:hypothetical protein [Anaerolineae bacterium]
MRIEIDQSGKIEHTQSNTVLAFSNDEEFALLILAVEKRACLKEWRGRGKNAKMLYQRLFAAALFLLIKNHLNQISLVEIDPEYPGRETEIRGWLIQHIRKLVPTFSPERIIFRRVGKRSRAHQKALAVFRNEEQANRKVRARDLLALLK